MRGLMHDTEEVCVSAARAPCPPAGPSMATRARYLSWNRMKLRPSTPPTFENSLFSSATQRIYLSATAVCDDFGTRRQLPDISRYGVH